LFLLAILAASLMGRNLAAPMRRIAAQADRMSKGLLTEVHMVAAEGESVDLASAFSRVQAHLKQVLNQLGDAGDSITATTDQLLTTSTHYEAGATDQATSLNETSSTTEELAQSARHISANSAEVSALAEKTLEAALNGQRSAEAFVTSVERMRHDNTSIHDAVTRLQKRVQQIGRIVEFITSVADRSDLLALSAELEGTKGGDVGRGFTLVAAEMRRLAENVIESTNEIEELIAEIREATLATVAATTSGSDQVTHGTRMASEVNSSLKTVVSLASTTSDAARSISLATQQQQSSTDQLAETMSDILGITQQSLAATKQVALANQELLNLSGELKSMVQRLEGEPDRNIA
jgi:methyl-accepting chemotaxis protein